jgi:iron complex outermembrane receptor protein
LFAPFTASFAQTDESGATLEEIVVTAQKRAENLQSVPVAVSAASGAELQRQGVIDVMALQNIAPGVQVSTGALGQQISIRGITSTNSTEVGDPAVAFHADGVYLGRPRSSSGTFYDIERIEVLRGPQGTLYGRNATAGSVNLITNKPKDVFEAAVGAETGNYDLISTTGMLNVPITSQLAFRTAFQTYKHSGYTDNAPAKDANDDDSRAARAHLLWTPAESISVLLSGDYFDNSRVGGQARPLPITGDADTFPINNAAGNPHNKQKQHGGSLTFNWNVGPGALTYIGGYRDDELASSGPSSTSPVPVAVTLQQNQQSHELRYAGETEALKWLGGAYYYDENQSVDVAIPSGPILLGFIQRPVRAESFALFTQETYSITPQLRLTGGLRYSEDKKSRLGGVFVNGALVSPNIADDEWSATNYRVALDWDVTDSSLLYGSVTTGYKAGGYMDGVPPNDYGPEHLTAFEVGSKNRFADDRVQLNLSGFYYNYRDYQVTYLGLLFPNSPSSPIISRTTNAKKAVSFGSEAELRFVITPRDRLNASASWLHARYKDLRLQSVDLFGNVDYTGNNMVGAPDYTATLGYEHTWSFAGAGSLTARGQAQYTGEQDLDYRNFPLTHQGGYTTANANLVYTSADERWSFELWGRNLTDKTYLVSAGPNTNPPNRNTGTGVLSVPRTYGARFMVHF